MMEKTMNTYSAINLGPLTSTINMARKPREMWAASYLFSYLMQCIVESMPPAAQLLSPAKVKTGQEGEMSKNDHIRGTGLYPDRAFIKGKIDMENTIDKAWEQFSSTLVKYGARNVSRDYFNIMHTSCEAESEADAIRILNRNMDKMELFCRAKSESDNKSVSDIVCVEKESPLYQIAYNTRRHHIPSLGEIAAVSMKPAGTEKEDEDARKREVWETFVKALDDDADTDDPYPKAFGSKYKSYLKYVCVVYADGDSVGTTVTHPELGDGKVAEISQALLRYGEKSVKTITDAGGLPIYAGGDDLLFIAPVVSADGTDIFGLLDKIRDDFSEVKTIIDRLKLKSGDKEIKASLTFGVSVSFYKYPLYEAFSTSQNLLFGTAKGFPTKNAVAWRLTKHSGGGFSGVFSYNDTNLKTAFRNLIDACGSIGPDDRNQSDGTNGTVSSAIHKIREYDSLLMSVMQTDRTPDTEGKSPRDIRLDSFFSKVLEEKDTPYFAAMKDVMKALYDHLAEYAPETNAPQGQEVKKETFIQTLYSLLRTARFIKGEDAKNE